MSNLRLYKGPFLFVTSILALNLNTCYQVFRFKARILLNLNSKIFNEQYEGCLNFANIFDELIVPL